MLENIPDAMGKAASDAVKKATDAADKASDVMENAPDSMGKAASDAVKKATDAADKASDMMKNTPDAAGKAASDAVKKATDAADKASDMMKNTPDAAGKAASDAVKKATDAADKASDVMKNTPDAAGKAASDAVKKATDAADKASDVMKNTPDAAGKAASDAVKKASDIAEYRGIILENQQDLFKDYDLDKLLHKIRAVLEHNNLKNVNKQFSRLFGKKDSSVYSCSFENAALDEQSQTVKKEMVQDHSTGDQIEVAFAEAKGKRHDHENSNHLKKNHKDANETGDHLKKAHDVSDHIEEQQSADEALFSSKALYKEGYDFIRSANYVEAEKTFCTFQNRYKKDPLSDDALFWLAESLLGQKRYHEAAQVYLTAWYADKKKLYTSEILLKLARSMVALEVNKEDCTHFVKKSKRQQTLASVFCKPAK